MIVIIATNTTFKTNTEPCDDENDTIVRRTVKRFLNSYENRNDDNCYICGSRYCSNPQLCNTNTNLKFWTTPLKIKNCIKSLKNNKAPGKDKISNLMLKYLPNRVITKIASIFNQCLKSSYFPQKWKEAQIVLFPKPGSNEIFPQNHRPISLLSSLGKIFEKVIYNRLKPYLSHTTVSDGLHGETLNNHAACKNFRIYW